MNILFIFKVDCYFSASDGNHIRLYQDAHCPLGLPQFNQLSIFSDEDPNCINYQPSSYFQDLKEALEQATTLICIAGWAVWDKLHLLRGMSVLMYSAGNLVLPKLAFRVR